MKSIYRICKFSLRNRSLGVALPALMLGFSFLVISPASASADTVNVYGTGLDSTGTPLPSGAVDSNYSLLSGPGFGAGQAFVNGWSAGAANTATSQWIGPDACGGCNFGLGDFLFQTTFSLSGFNLSTVQLTGQWATDNEGTIILNGANTGIGLGCCSFGALTPFTISSGFVPGVNTIVFDVHNDGGPTALQVQISGTGSPVGAAVPEPSTLIMLGTGFLGVAEMLRRRRQRA